MNIQTFAWRDFNLASQDVYFFLNRKRIQDLSQMVKKNTLKPEQFKTVHHYNGALKSIADMSEYANYGLFMGCASLAEVIKYNQLGFVKSSSYLYAKNCRLSKLTDIFGGKSENICKNIKTMKTLKDTLVKHKIDYIQNKVTVNRDFFDVRENQEPGSGYREATSTAMRWYRDSVREFESIFKKEINSITTWKQPRMNNVIKAASLVDGKTILLNDDKPIAIYPYTDDLLHGELIEYMNLDNNYDINFDVHGGEFKFIKENSKISTWKTIALEDYTHIDKHLKGLKKSDFMITPNPAYLANSMSPGGTNFEQILLTKKNVSIKPISNNSKKWTLPNGFSLKNISDYFRAQGVQTSSSMKTKSFYFKNGNKEIRISDHLKHVADRVTIESDGASLQLTITILFDEITSSAKLVDIVQKTLLK